MNNRKDGWRKNLIEPEQLFTPPGASDPAAEEPDLDSTSSLPKITRLPEGIEVVEQSVGRATGTWVLQVRCQCGRRWFEMKPVEATHCPRCGMYVYIDVQGERPTI